ncbi:unnamed protein product [Orchesella dallaii]|uniref:Uncharacterized protein n=1 Tax=Orchesella dallaii TaxID=48710 RepID=A0ABP1R2K2_9HEXA
MIRWICGSLLLIVVVGLSTAESVRNVAELKNVGSKGDDQNLEGDSGKLDYESALRPAVLQKRSIANIARLLLGVGNIPPNHPLVKYPEPKSWNLASNIASSLPAAAASSLVAAAANQHGWGPNQPSSALQNIQQLFETKSKIIPFTGQVATGLTGLATVKGDILRQIHSISTQAIAQAAAEAAARALASAAAAHAVTNSIAHSVSPGAQTGIKGGWSSNQNMYANPPGKTPGEQPGPPYQAFSDSAHINNYQPPPSYNSNPYSVPATTPPPNYQRQQGDLYSQSQFQNQNNGFYTLYNTQPATSAHAPVPYTPAPPVAPARPTLSPNTLIATTPSGYSPSLSNPFAPYGRGRFMVIPSGSNNIPLTSFRRAVPAGIFGRYAAQPSPPSSLLSSITSLLTASTAAYNAAVAASNPAPTAVFSNLLSSGSSPIPTPSILRPTSPIPAPTVLGSGISSAVGSQFFNPALQRQPINPEFQRQSSNPEFQRQPIHSEFQRQTINPQLQRQTINSELQRQSINPGIQRQQFNSVPQISGNYGGPASGISAGHIHQQLPSASTGYSAQASAPAVNPPSNSFNQYATSYLQTNYVQPGANPYTAQSVQSPQFSGLGPAAAAAGASPGSNPGAGANYAGFSTGNARPGNPGYNGGSGPSPGHVSGWNTQHAGSPASSAPWATSPNQYTPGYSSQAAGNPYHPSGSVGGGAAQFQTQAGSGPVQQAYPAHQTHAYQSPATNPFAQAQPQPQPQLPNPYASSSELNPQYQYTNNGRADSVGGVRNPNLNYQDDSHDLRQSASTMGNDYDDDHSYQQAPRRNRPTNKPYSTARPRPRPTQQSSSRYPRPSKKRPTKRPMNHHHQQHHYKNGNRDNTKNKNNNNHAGKEQTRNVGNNRNQGEYDGPRVYKTGSKKGSQFDSSVDVEVVDDTHDDYFEGDQYYNESEEIRNPNTDPDDPENRWRTQNSSGQPANSIHNHNSNGRWKGKQTHTKQVPPKNVSGHGRGSDRFSSQPGRPKGSREDFRNQKTNNIPRERVPEKAQPRPKPTGEPSTEAAKLYRGRLREQQQQQYESRDVYTTLPQYVFRVDERPDVFLRPVRKQKHRTNFWGKLKPRVGETNGVGVSSDGPSTANNIEGQAENAIPQTFSRKNDDQENVEEPTGSSGPLFESAPRRREDEVVVSVSKALDETARADVLSGDQGFISESPYSHNIIKQIIPNFQRIPNNFNNQKATFTNNNNNIMNNNNVRNGIITSGNNYIVDTRKFNTNTNNVVNNFKKTVTRSINLPPVVAPPDIQYYNVINKAASLTKHHPQEPVLIPAVSIFTSEELDPEEREAFVDDVYADDLHRRQDYGGDDDGDGDEESVNNTEEAAEDDEVKK